MNRFKRIFPTGEYDWNREAMCKSRLVIDSTARALVSVSEISYNKARSSNLRGNPRSLNIVNSTFGLRLRLIPPQKWIS